MNRPMQRQLNRNTPELGPEHMRTHAILAPLATHFRKATCEEVECEHYAHGWGVPAKHLTEQDLHDIKASGRAYTKVQIKEGEDHLWFAPGQPCFRASIHVIRIDRPELFVVRDGDWRGNPRKTETQVFSSADSWADSLNTNLEQLQG